MKAYESIIVVLILLAGLYVLALPINDYPFGDVDSSTHFALGDAMGQSNRPLYSLPFYLNYSYGFANDGKIWYSPQYHFNMGFLQKGDRIISPFFYIAFTAAVVILSVYLLARIFGIWIAILASSMAAFGVRDYMTYLWGQWPQLLSFAYVPAIIYCFYSYEKDKPVYLYLAALFVSFQFYFHPQAIIHSVLSVALYSAFLLYKKNLYLSWKHVVLSLIILLVFMIPFLPFSWSIISGQASSANMGATLFKWYPDPAKFAGIVPPEYFSYSFNYGLWTLVFLILGIIFLLFAFQNKNAALLAWLVAFYIITRINNGRLHKSFTDEGHLFFILMALGMIAIPVLLKRVELKKYFGIAALVAVVLLMLIPAKDVLSQSYTGINRITPYELEAADWMRQNLPAHSHTFIFGTFIYSKEKWMQALSQRHLVWAVKDFPNFDHAIVDYSDAVLTGSDTKDIAAFEKSLNTTNVLYNKDYVKVFDLETRS